jgi:hypothetical protein
MKIKLFNYTFSVEKTKKTETESAKKEYSGFNSL